MRKACQRSDAWLPVHVFSSSVSDEFRRSALYVTVSLPFSQAAMQDLIYFMHAGTCLICMRIACFVLLRQFEPLLLLPRGSVSGSESLCFLYAAMLQYGTPSCRHGSFVAWLAPRPPWALFAAAWGRFFPVFLLCSSCRFLVHEFRQ